MKTRLLLKAHDLRKSFGGQVVLDGIDLELHQGEVVLLRGENGSGKTTLLNMLTGTLEPDAGYIEYHAKGTPRSYGFPRRWWQELNPFDHFTPESVAHHGVGRTWQDVRLFGAQSLRDNIAVAHPEQPGENPLTALVFPGKIAQRELEIAQQADEILARFGLKGREQSSGDKVSLGQSKRVAIARAVAAGAKVLFLDEPLAGLDKDGIRDVLELLTFVVKHHQATLIVVEHIFNHPHLDGLLTTDWLLTNGRIQSAQAEEQVNGVTQRVPVNGAAKEIPWVSLFADADAEIINEPLPRGALLTRIRRPGIFVEPQQAVLEIRDLVVTCGKRVVLGTDEDGAETGLDLTVYQGEIVILQAPNGWGKTTLFNAITGLFPAQRGTISLLNKPLSKLKTWERIRRGLTVLPSENVGFSSLGVQDSLRLAGDKGLQLDVDSLGNRAVSSLSGGERRRLALAGLQEGHIAVCDEPFGALDGEWARNIAHWLSQRLESIFIVEPYRNI